MKTNMPLRYRLSAGALGLLMLGAVTSPADAFVLTSTTFKDGEMMPPRVSNKPLPNPNCVGDNVSPQLSWASPPAGTKSYAFTLVDPEGYGGMGVVHWVAYGIAANVTSFKEGELSSPRPNLSAARAPRASNIIPDLARRPARRIIMSSGLSQPISTRWPCRPALAWTNCNPALPDTQRAPRLSWDYLPGRLWISRFDPRRRRS
jgi:hypothetical protein